MITKEDKEVLKIIHDLKYSQLQSGTEDSVAITNLMHNWYWSVGFVSINIIPDNKLVIIKVNRPNKFIGNHNFLVDVNNAVNTKLGYTVKLKKSINTKLYNAFFGIDETILMKPETPCSCK